MTIKQLRARIDRLERSAKAKVDERKLPFEFPIDPALANALRDDRKRLDELELERERQNPTPWRPTNDGETEEERMLRARIAERARTISCPASYGFNEVWDDRMRLVLLRHGELLPCFAHITLNEVEDPDAAEAQLIARIEAFNQSPEGRARDRIESLTRIDYPSSEEESELDRLLMLYPEPDTHPKSMMRNALVGWRDGLIKFKKETRKRMEERALQEKKSRRRAD